MVKHIQIFLNYKNSYAKIQNMNQTQTQKTTFETYQSYRENALLNNKDKTIHPIIHRYNKNTPSRIQHISTSKLAAMTTGNIIRISASSSSKGINLISSRQNSNEKISNTEDYKSKVVDAHDSQTTSMQNQSFMGMKNFQVVLKNQIERASKHYTQLMQKLLFEQQHFFQIQINKLNDIIRQNEIKIEMQKMKLEEYYEKQEKREKRNAEKIHFLRVDIEGLMKFQQQCDYYTLGRITDIEKKLAILKEKQQEISPFCHRQVIQLIRNKVVNIISHYFQRQILERQQCIFVVKNCQSSCENLKVNMSKIQQQGQNLWCQLSLKNQVLSQQIQHFKNHLKVWQQQEKCKQTLNQISSVEQRQVDYEKLKNTFQRLKNSIEVLEQQNQQLDIEKKHIMQQLRDNEQRSQKTITQLSKMIHSLKAEQEQFTAIYHQEINQKQHECSILKNQLQNSQIFETVTEKQVKTLQQKNAQLCIQLRRKQTIYEKDIFELTHKMNQCDNIYKQQTEKLHELIQSLKNENQRQKNNQYQLRQLQEHQIKIHEQQQKIVIKQRQNLRQENTALKQQLKLIQQQLQQSIKQNKVLRINAKKLIEKKQNMQICKTSNLFLEITKSKKNMSSITEIYDLSIPLEQLMQSSLQIKQQLSTKSQYLSKIEEKFNLKNKQNMQLKELIELSKDQNIRLRKAITQLQKQNRYLMQAKHQAIEANDKYQANMNQYINTFQRHSFAFQNTIKALQQQKQKLQQQINQYKNNQRKSSLQKCLSSSILGNSTQSPTSMQSIAYKTISFDQLGLSKKILEQSQLSPSYNSINLSRYSNTSGKKTIKSQQNINRLQNALKQGQHTLPLQCEIDQTGYLKSWQYGTYIIDQNGNLFDLNQDQLKAAIQFKLILLR